MENIGLSKYLSKVFLWMFIGLGITFITGQLVANNPNLVEQFLGKGFYMLILAEVITVIALSAAINKMSPTVAKMAFIFYSFLSGLTFSTIFVVYQASSIIIIFLLTATVMSIMGLIGMFTKIDLSKLGTFLCIGLIVSILVGLVNLFIGNIVINFILVIGVLFIFIIFVAYDMQKIKRIYNSNPDDDKLVILGALELYLDFINIFIRLMQLFGKEK